MEWGFLSFAGQPWFVIPWYLIGILGVWFLVYDLHNNNTVLKPAMKWAWPIIVFFFSVIGIALYFATARAPGIGKIDGEEEKQKRHNRYEANTWRRVNGAVIHCVAGDGLGIMTAMVIARAAGMSFWQEFWFEYLVGFVIGWLIYQRKSMTMMTDSIPRQLAMAFRGEFFSMLTVMAGMGAVMAYVTPLVATQQPKPLTAAFWGFGMLGLLVGYLFTLPMNWMMVKLGWKHGLGGMKGAEAIRVERKSLRSATVVAMVVLGIGAEFLPAWLSHVHETAGIEYTAASFTLTPEIGIGDALHDGLNSSVREAVDALDAGERTRAALRIDAALRLGEVASYSAPGSFYHADQQIRRAKLAIEQGQIDAAKEHLVQAQRLALPASSAQPPALELSRYTGARVLDQRGRVIGRVIRAAPRTGVEIAVRGWQDAWGLIDISSGSRLTVPVRALAFSAPKAVGYTMVAVATGAASAAR